MNAAGGVRVLLVEDEPDLRSALATMLQLEDIEVLTARGGREGLAVFSRGGIDAVIADVRMPDGDGLELLAGIRGRDIEVPVILMSAFADLTAAVAYDLGASGLHSKPFVTRELFNQLMESIALRKNGFTVPPAEVPRALVEASLPAFDEASRSRRIALGHGGLTVHARKPNVRPGTPVTLRLRFIAGTPARIDASGVLRWVEGRGEFGFAVCGVEIQYLEPDCREAVAAMMKGAGRAFIPAI